MFLPKAEAVLVLLTEGGMLGFNPLSLKNALWRCRGCVAPVEILIQFLGDWLGLKRLTLGEGGRNKKRKKTLSP